MYMTTIPNDGGDEATAPAAMQIMVNASKP
jgi:hypothetical protein